VLMQDEIHRGQKMRTKQNSVWRKTNITLFCCLLSKCH
jgi:hypothetical protein